MAFTKQFIKIEWLRKGVMSIHIPHTGQRTVVDFIPRLSFTSLFSTQYVVSTI